jgi:hypothetical protein
MLSFPLSFVEYMVECFIEYMTYDNIIILMTNGMYDCTFKISQFCNWAQWIKPVNPNYSRGRDWKDHGLRPDWAEVHTTPISTNGCGSGMGLVIQCHKGRHK